MDKHPGVFAALTPDRPAIIMAETGQIITFAQYESLSNQCAHLLRAHGLQRGDCVAIFMDNNAHYLPIAWGGMRAGLRVTTIASHLSVTEVDYILQDSAAKALFISMPMAEVATQLSALNPPAASRFVLDGELNGFSSLQDALAALPETPIADQSEGVEMLYSSGTTGRPKAVRKQLPETPFGSPSPWHTKQAKLYGFDENSIYLSPAPLYHAAPLMTNIRINRFGGTCIVMKKFDARRALALIEQYRVTCSQWVPTHFVRLLRLPEDDRNCFDLSSHQTAIHAAAPCPVPIKQQMIDWWGPIILEYYAGSEGNGYVFINSQQWLQKPGSVGQAFLGTLHICDDNGQELPVGQEGTVFIEGGPAFQYHNDPTKTAASRNAQGWSTLGDIGYLDSDGYLFLTDRKAFMILSGGVNIYPQEIENLLINHPSVSDVAVFGVPNAEFGEEVKAVIQPFTMDDATDELAMELLEFCKTRISHVKCPRSIDFIAQMPREENGKLYKRKLRDTYWQA